MKLPNVYYCGYGFVEKFNEKITKLEYNNDDFNESENVETFNINITWGYQALAINQKLILSGFFSNENTKNNKKIFHFNDKIIKVASNDKHCLILLNNGDIFQYNIAYNILKQINSILQTENSLNNNNNKILSNKIVFIDISSIFSIGITVDNCIYNIPTKIYQLNRNDNVKKITCGIEHAILLTKNGDIYTWGTGTRGQLGHGELESEEEPRLVEALAGVKIIDVAAGGWHSAAISVFGDLYTWGWNAAGQLGIKLTKIIKSNELPIKLEKNPMVYASPQLIDFTPNESETEINIKNVACGNRHTIIKTEENHIYASGLNHLGQLGFKNNSDENFIDSFQKINFDLFKDFDIVCGCWTTMFIEK